VALLPKKGERVGSPHDRKCPKFKTALLYVLRLGKNLIDSSITTSVSRVYALRPLISGEKEKVCPRTKFHLNFFSTLVSPHPDLYGEPPPQLVASRHTARLLQLDV